MITGQPLFSPHILYAMNALQHLRTICILGETTDDIIYSTCDDIAREIGAPRDSLYYALMHLTRDGIVAAKKGPGGGYYVTANIMAQVKLQKVISVLGKELPDNKGNIRASDKLINVVADCLDITLDKFLR